MKQPYQLLSELVTLLEEFTAQKKHEEMSLESFILWLNSEVLFKQTRLSNNLNEPNQPKGHHPGDINIKLTFFLIMMSKHFKVYSKKVLVDSDLVSIDGHTFLATLYHAESLRKMELINVNYTEVPTGIEVINRLLKKGFIEEFDDPNDKRSKRVRITKTGKTEFENTFPHMKKVIKIMGGNLSEEQKIQLISFLKQLNDFHVSLYKEAKTLSLDQLVEQV